MTTAANIQASEMMYRHGFGNKSTSSIIERGLATLSQPIDLIGKTTVDILLREIESKSENSTPETIVLKTDLIVRNSLLRRKLSAWNS